MIKLALFLWHLLVICVAYEEHQAAFVQTGDELRYFSSARQLQEGFGVQNVANSVSADGPSQKTGEHNFQLRFDPPSLNFGQQSIGIPRLLKISVANPTNFKIRFDAISASTLHFHCSFFELKTLDPEGITTLDVVFLPRSQSPVEDVLFFYTSIGAFMYSVSGEGVDNPYRIRPLVGAKVPLNGSFITPVRIHNPHSTTLRVTEMYTSGGDLHLEPPSGAMGVKNFDVKLWEVPPYRTRTVMKARFLAAREDNSTSYVKIKTNQTQNSLVLPLQMEVTSAPGLYATVDVIDFGSVRSDKGSHRHMELGVINAIDKPLSIESVTILPTNEALSVQFEKRELQSDPSSSVIVARLTFWGDSAKQETYSGDILVKTNFAEFDLMVPYSVRVIQGSLLFDDQKLSFFAGLSAFNTKQPIGTIESRNVTLTSTCSQPVAIFNVQLPYPFIEVFKITILTPLLQPGEPTEAINVEFGGNIPKWQNIKGDLTINTNASMYFIPIAMFSGHLRLTIHSVDRAEFNFGTLNTGDSRFLLFAVTNENPVDVTLEKFINAVDVYTDLELLGVEPGNETVLANLHDPSEHKWEPGFDLTIPAKNFAVFRYTVTAPLDRAVFRSTMQFKTKYETRHIAVHFLVEEGSLFAVPPRIKFDDAFPGKLSAQPLQLFSTFDRNMTVLGLGSFSNDPRFFFEPLNPEQPIEIAKNKLTFLGRTFFLPSAQCGEQCYVGLPLDSKAGAKWVNGLTLPPELPQIDAVLFEQLHEKWRQLKTTNQNIINSTFMVDTTEVRSFPIPAEGHLVWPRLMPIGHVHFPMTAVNNMTIVNMTLRNPSSLPVVVQLLPLALYPNSDELTDLFREDFFSKLTELVEYNDAEMFTVRDCELYNSNPVSPVPRFRQEIERQFNISTLPRHTLTMTLYPGMKVRIRIGFRPIDLTLRSSLLLIRNNLTILEGIPMYGRGGKAELRVKGIVPYGQQPLYLEVPHRQLQECDNFKTSNSGKRRKTLFPVLVNKSFIVRNTGELTVHVSNVTISGLPCQNEGFRVMNCDPFSLKPNQTKVLDIVFLPDFTQALYQARLQLHIEGQTKPFAWIMGSQIPREFLAKCQAAMPKPPWEPVMYYICVTALMFLLVFCIAAAYLEGDRVITCAIREQKLSARYTLDLNANDMLFTNGTLKSVKQKLQKQPSNTVSEAEPAVVVPDGEAAATSSPRGPHFLARVVLFIIRLVVKPIESGSQSLASLSSSLQTKHRNGAVESRQDVVSANGVGPKGANKTRTVANRRNSNGDHDHSSDKESTASGNSSFNRKQIKATPITTVSSAKRQPKVNSQAGERGAGDSTLATPSPPIVSKGKRSTGSSSVGNAFDLMPVEVEEVPPMQTKFSVVVNATPLMDHMAIAADDLAAKSVSKPRPQPKPKQNENTVATEGKHVLPTLALTPIVEPVFEARLKVAEANRVSKKKAKRVVSDTEEKNAISADIKRKQRQITVSPDPRTGPGPNQSGPVEGFNQASASNHHVTTPLIYDYHKPVPINSIPETLPSPPVASIKPVVNNNNTAVRHAAKATPFNIAAKLTQKVVKGVAKKEIGGSSQYNSESEESTLPDWDMPSHNEATNFDDFFNDMKHQTDSFVKSEGPFLVHLSTKALERAYTNNNTNNNNNHEIQRHHSPTYHPQANIAPRFRNQRQQQRMQQGGMHHRQTRGRGGAESTAPESMLSSSSRSTSLSSVETSSSDNSRKLRSRTTPRVSAVHGQKPKRKSSSKTKEILPGIIGSPHLAAASGKRTKSGLSKITLSGGSGNETGSIQPRGLAAPIPGTPLTPDRYMPDLGVGTHSFQAGLGVAMSGLNAGTKPAPIGLKSNNSLGLAYMSQQESKQRVEQNDSPSLMKQLQEDRKARFMDYKMKKTLRGDDWPGMEMPPMGECLWDEGSKPWESHGLQIAEVGYGLDPLDSVWSAKPMDMTAVWAPHTGHSPRNTVSPPVTPNSPNRMFRPTPRKPTVQKQGSGSMALPLTDSSIVAWGGPAVPDGKRVSRRVSNTAVSKTISESDVSYGMIMDLLEDDEN